MTTPTTKMVRNLARAAAQFAYARRLIAHTRTESSPALRAWRAREARHAVRLGRTIRANAETWTPSPNEAFNY